MSIAVALDDLAGVLAEHPWGYLVTVRDDGIGFAEDRDATDGEAHIGLQIMRERALRIGGRFAVRSSPGRGTEIRLELPRTNEVEA